MAEPLRYRISNWHQLPMCKSNMGNALAIEVSDIMEDYRLSAIRISVIHSLFGYLYSTIINARGSILYNEYEPTGEDILKNLERFGFLVEFSEREHLSGNAIQKLMTLNTLGFNKIRWLAVRDPQTDRTKQYVVAFMIVKNPNWLDYNYEATIEEFNTALNDGSAMNISALSYVQGIDWSWLDYVANIDDILRDNS